MEFGLNLAGINITITLLDQAQEGAWFCNSFFRDFFHQNQPTVASVEVSTLGRARNGFPLKTRDQNRVLEQLLPAKETAAWLRDTLNHTRDSPIHEKLIYSFCLGGLLIFDPETAKGHIYLLRKGRRRFQPFLRIFWMFFAQVLGEQNSCFVHCAALAKDHEGALFFGDSGAGKSTLAANSNGCLVFSDDSPIFGKQNGEYQMFPAPFHQLDPLVGLKKEIIGQSARVNALYFLTKDKGIHLKEISKSRALSMIIKRYIHFFPYLSPDAKTTLFDLFFEACDNVPAYYFHIGRSQDVPGIITHR